jgi:conjugative relaxase-like TrwC/TraI family protein
MLRIIESTSPGGAKGYYSTADYFTEGQELQGRWRGKGAERLGLSGPVDQAAWDALCDNKHPATGEPLTPRLKQNRRVGWDLNFHAPKALSLLYGLTEDPRLLDAFGASVDETMRDIEADVKTRVRKGGRDEDRLSGNLCWGTFVHTTARPVNGIPDPHLHAHCFAFNLTFDGHEDRWKAAQIGDVKRDAGFYEAKFHARLSRRLAELGLPVERTRKGWTLAGLGDATLDNFSRRTAQIEKEARAKGITAPAEKAALGARTRAKKAKQMSMAQLRAEWRQRLTTGEANALDALAARIGQEPDHGDERAAAVAAVTLAADHCFERESVVPERTWLRESLRRSYGVASPESVEAEAARRDLIRGDREGQRWVTTPEVLAEESAVVSFARKGRDTRMPLGRGEPHAFKRTWLNDGQKRAVGHVLECSDRVMIIRGAAGVGKTTTMEEAVEAIEAAGHRVVTVAPSSGASRGELRAAGFADADTVARLLVDKQMQEKLRGNVLWVDEAGLVGMRTMKRLFDLAQETDARVILSGDRRQHGPVEHGAALRLLETDAGLVPAEITEIQRQAGAYKRAVEHLSEGRVAAGFKALDGLGWIREVEDAHRYQAIAGDYVASTVAGQNTLVIAPTHAEGHRTSDAIRDGLRHAGLLGREERAFDVLSPANLTAADRADRTQYNDGDVIVFHQNAVGHKKGTRITVTPGADLPLDQAERFTAYRSSHLTLAAGDRVRVTANGKTKDGQHRLSNGDLFTVAGFTPAGDVELANGWTVGREFGFLTRGFVITSYSSQGKSVDKVIIAASAASLPAISKEQFYVSASRGKSAVSVYTDSKADLLAAVRRTDDRPSATAFVADRARREGRSDRKYRERAVHLQRVAAAMPAVPAAPGHQRGMTHER